MITTCPSCDNPYDDTLSRIRMLCDDCFLPTIKSRKETTMIMRTCAEPGCGRQFMPTGNRQKFCEHHKPGVKRRIQDIVIEPQDRAQAPIVDSDVAETVPKIGSLVEPVMQHTVHIPVENLKEPLPVIETDQPDLYPNIKLSNSVKSLTIECNGVKITMDFRLI